MDQWYALYNPEEVPSPALLLYPDRISGNIEKMIAMAGDVNRLRPHVKTHKMPQLIALQVSYGIKKFKCATIAETEMVAAHGGDDILLAYQPVGPNIPRLVSLIKAYPQVKFSALVDNKHTLEAISAIASASNLEINLYVDIDNGMHRTGVSELPEAVDLIQKLINSPGVIFSGLHVYDGHIHEPNPKRRERECLKDFALVDNLMRQLSSRSITVPVVIAGGTPTFPIHARFSGRELSPGTPVLWDIGYSLAFQDLNFAHAAVIMSRVVSNPQHDKFCLDLGYKAIAAEMDHPRVHLQNIGTYRIETHSEEHLVIQPDTPDRLNVGDIVYGIPMHICPTVALYDYAYIIKNHNVIDTWKVLGRKRIITV
jgi:D-serine deaminase-like pyridoxal phosphate-dependent protein